MNATLRHALPWLVIGLLGLMLKCGYDGRRRAEGVMVAQLQTADSTLKALRQSTQAKDRQYATDTASLRVELARWQAVKQRAVRLPAPPPDTVDGPERIVVVRDSAPAPPLTIDDLIRQADSAIGVCTTALSTCEVRVAQRDSTIRTLTFERDLWRRKSQPSLLTRISTAGKWLAVGYLIGVTR